MRGPFTGDESTWEEEERAMARKHIVAGMNVLELGGGLGVVTRTMVERGAALVWVFEPQAHLYRYRDERVRLFPVAGDTYDGMAPFGFNSEWWGSGIDATHPYGELEVVKEVPVLDVWRIAADMDANALVMDIEGTEARLLADEQLSRIPDRLRLLIFERHQADPVLPEPWRMKDRDDTVEVWVR